MIIDFAKEDFIPVPNFKGGEGHLDAKMFNDDKVRICSGRLEPGSTIGYHKHKQNSEVVFVLSGKLIGKFDDEVEEVSAGQIHYCPMGHSHGFRNASETEIAEILCVVPEHHVVE